MISADDELGRILREARTIAVVGLSADPEKPSHEVAAYLQAHGYRIIPVNPRSGARIICHVLRDKFRLRCHARFSE
jgi:predicted CoA-binding protein